MKSSVKRIESMDEVEAIPTDATLEPIPLQPPNVAGRFLHVDLDGVVIDAGNWGCDVATRGVTPSRFGFFVSLNDSVATGDVNGEPLGQRILHVVKPGAEVAVMLPRDLHWASVQIERELLDPLLDWSDNDFALTEVPAHTAIESERSLRLADLVSDVIGTMSADENPGLSIARYVADDIAAATIDVLAGEQMRRAGPAALIESRRIVEACESFAVGRRFVDVTHAQLCHVALVSERRIRSAFQAVFGMSTMEYLRRLALTEARARLLAADPRTATVSEVAADLGFWHLSRFAARYRALFGEMPSATLSAASSAT